MEVHKGPRNISQDILTHWLISTQVMVACPEVDVQTRSITGHSMGGHGALTIALKQPAIWRSMSAFSPICNPTTVPWGPQRRDTQPVRQARWVTGLIHTGQKAFEGYLGSLDAGLEHDACELVKKGPRSDAILVSQGADDDFLVGDTNQLQPEAFRSACDGVGQELDLRYEPGYDHSDFFIQSFIDRHDRRPARGAGPGRPLARRQRVRLLRPPRGRAALLHRVLVPLRRGRPALAPHRRARRRRHRPGDPRRRDRGGVCPRIHYQRCFVVALPAPNRLALASRYVFCLPFLHAQDPGGGRAGGRVPGSPRLFPASCVFLLREMYATPMACTARRHRATPSPRRRSQYTQVLCGNECCETYWCVPCIACYLMRHDISAKQPGQNYQGCGNMSGTVYDLPA